LANDNDDAGSDFSKRNIIFQIHIV
jgi:hypothetical protein